MQLLLVSSLVEHWQLDVSMLSMIGKTSDYLIQHPAPQRVPRLPSEEP